MEAVRQAQDVLENHIEPGGPICEETIHELLGIFDDHRLVMAWTRSSAGPELNEQAKAKLLWNKTSPIWARPAEALSVRSWEAAIRQNLE
jgi:hypothetical protein